MTSLKCGPPELRALRKSQTTEVAWAGVTGSERGERTDRVGERRRAVAPARHYREFEVPDECGDSGASRSFAGDCQGVLLTTHRREGAGAQARYVGVCRGCGA
jgi:hypothetical protein